MKRRKGRPKAITAPYVGAALKAVVYDSPSDVNWSRVQSCSRQCGAPGENRTLDLILTKNDFSVYSVYFWLFPSPFCPQRPLEMNQFPSGCCHLAVKVGHRYGARVRREMRCLRRLRTGEGFNSCLSTPAGPLFEFRRNAK